ncbi:MAG: bifunctional diaminohydroxyphosphoribosylaminopyrimidine deaminase/5-amino-6-(5-phosphoribosylamino)uracil reductase RibD [Sumerlaeia bacterium]
MTPPPETPAAIESAMRRALDLARRAEGQTRPNPLVGAVILREGRVIGEGFHARAGEPHAEAQALTQATEDPRGATMVVTLEPCSHHGRTPPCSDAVIRAGIARVVIAQRDPNPLARGGVERLREAGVAVETGVMEQEAMLLNPAFNTYHQLGRPLVTLKWAMSADGCTASSSGHSAWITSPESRTRAHAMRAAHDAVLVGVETALMDGAKLTIRHVEQPPGPPLRRIVLDSQLRLPPGHPLVTETQGRAVVVCADNAPADREMALTSEGAEVWRLRPGVDGRVSLADLMLTLRGHGIQSVLVEGGRRVAGQMIRFGFADRVAAFLAPVLIGAGGAPLSALTGDDPITTMSDALRLHHARFETIGPDVLMEGWITRHLFEDVAPAGTDR